METLMAWGEWPLKVYGPRETESLLAIVCHTLKGLAFDFVLILLINILIKIVFITRKVISHEKLAQEKDNEVGTQAMNLGCKTTRRLRHIIWYYSVLIT